jgi:hypothetical protein
MRARGGGLSRGGIMDIAAWLRSLGLEQYGATFGEHDIDAEVLPELTEGDLERLGISLGHRKRLLKAIRALQSETPAEQSAASPATLPSLDSAILAERRQLTVMFCDLVGSTELASQLDPEDLREVINRYHACVTETVGRFDGFVAKYMGDGVFAYFDSTWTVTSRFLRLRHCKSLIQLRRSRPSENV